MLTKKGMWPTRQLCWGAWTHKTVRISVAFAIPPVSSCTWARNASSFKSKFLTVFLQGLLANPPTLMLQPTPPIPLISRRFNMSVVSAIDYFDYLHARIRDDWQKIFTNEIQRVEALQHSIPTHVEKRVFTSTSLLTSDIAKGIPRNDSLAPAALARHKMNGKTL